MLKFTRGRLSVPCRLLITDLSLRLKELREKVKTELDVEHA